ncbi:hypothetical protein [uncultured Croceitalea sp.]|uniref:hypothetical protein n=1 Tax=uncultured Croceitalea sp. TaxID=1798908 RepID=UPI00374E5275
MKKIYILTILLFSFSCSDGDLQIEAIDFDDITAQNCETLSINTRLFFKINGDEALILELDQGLLLNEVSTEVITSSIPGNSQLTYRLFDDTVTSNYFCDDIPPATPTVIEDIEASDGNVLITTTTMDSITFTHTIQLQGIIITNAAGESIIDLTTSEFEIIETSN